MAARNRVQQENFYLWITFVHSVRVALYWRAQAMIRPSPGEQFRRTAIRLS